MDAALLGVIIGSALSLLGTFGSQWFALRKEEKLWLRQQAEEERKRVRDEQAASKEKLREVYENSIRCLSLLVADDAKEQKVRLADPERLQLFQEAQRWLTMLSFYHRDTFETSNGRIHWELKKFIEEPFGNAATLREEVIKLAMNDNLLFPKVEKPIVRPGEKTIRIQVDEQFRRQELLKGIEIQSSHEFTCHLSKLSTKQREKLITLYFDSHKDIPQTFSLYLPIFNAHKKRILLSGIAWNARLNPSRMKPEEILNAWEITYEEALERAQDEYNAYLESNQVPNRPNSN